MGNPKTFLYDFLNQHRPRQGCAICGRPVPEEIEDKQMFLNAGWLITPDEKILLCPGPCEARGWKQPVHG